MSSKTHWGDLAVAVLGGTLLGGGIGLGAGFLARSQGWPTHFVGALTGSMVGVLVTTFYHMRSRRHR